MRHEAQRQLGYRLEWTVVGVLAAVAVALGYVGFADVYPDERFTQLLYRSLQLFVLESGTTLPEGAAVPLSLEIARVLAPALTVYAAIRTLFLLFREQLEFFGSRFVLRDHAVIAGLGAKGFTLAKALRAAGVRVVVLEQDEANPAIPGCRRRGIRVLVGDASDPALLDKARVGSARWLVVVAGANRVNVEIAFAVRALADANGGAPTVWVHLDDLVLWRLLQAEVLSVSRRSRVRLEFFNVHEAAARMLLEELPVSTGGEERPAHLLVLGAGALGESLILQVARLRRADDGPGKLRVTLGCRGAARGIDRLSARYPALEQSVELQAWEIDYASAPPSATAVFVCLEDEDAGLIAALALHNRPELLGVPIVLAVDDDESGVAIALRGSGALRDVVPFGILSRTLAPELLLRGTNELLAQAKHAHYLECERARGVDVATNQSFVPWHQLPEGLRESNRLFADSVGQKLEAAGLALLPAPLPDGDAPTFAFSEDEIEELGRAEHDRWEHDLTEHGWRFGPVKDPARKLHPSLVPWSELSEEERDKDREPVRALPEMLARLGFAIVRSEDARALGSWAPSRRGVSAPDRN